MGRFRLHYDDDHFLDDRDTSKNNTSIDAQKDNDTDVRTSDGGLPWPVPSVSSRTPRRHLLDRPLPSTTRLLTQTQSAAGDLHHTSPIYIIRAEDPSVAHEDDCWPSVARSDDHFELSARRTKRNKWRLGLHPWGMALLIVLIAYGLGKEWCPPAPPYSILYAGEDWTAYLRRHGYRILSSTVDLGHALLGLLVVAPVHVLSYQARDGVGLLLHHYHRIRSCPLRVPPHMDWEEQLNKGVVGQETAARHLALAFQKWDPTQCPLLLYLVGHEHVGKRTMARQLAHLLHLEPCPTEAILWLTGPDWIVQPGRPEAVVKAEMQHRIMQHVDARRGAVIVLRDADQMEGTVLSWLWDELAGPKRGSRDGFAHQCHHVVFVFISTTVGAQSIHLRIRRGGSLADVDLMNEIVYEMDSYYQRRPTDDSLANIFDSIAPFGLLYQSHLLIMLQRRMTNVWHINMTDSAAQAMVSDYYIEYADFQGLAQPGDAQPRVFAQNVALRGAAAFDTLWDLVEAKIKSCRQENWSRGQGVLALEDSEENRGEWALQWCRPPTPCEQVCRFRLTAALS